MHDDVESDLAELLARVPAPAYDPELIEETIMKTSTDRRRPLVIAVIILSVIVAAMGIALLTRNDGPIRGVDPLNTPSTSVPQPSRTPTPSGPVTTAEPTANEPTSSASSSTSEPSLVDAAAYAALGGAGEGHYFVSPSGNFLCGITDDLVGCQSRVVVTGMDACGTNPDWSSAMVSWSPGTVAEPTCTTQGVFVTETPVPVLEYGTALQVGDALCISEPTGISCRQVSTGMGFTIATQGIKVQS